MEEKLPLKGGPRPPPWAEPCRSRTRATRALHHGHTNMAANIEQIFQDFILNKIREIEDQQEDNGYLNLLYTF